MDRNTLLIRDQIDSGNTLLAELRERGLEIATAFWAFLTESEAWYLYLACPGVELTGARPAYLTLHKMTDRIEELGIDIFTIRIIGLRDSMAVAAAQIVESRTGGLLNGFPGVTRYRDSTLGGFPVDGVIIYPRSPVAASA